MLDFASWHGNRNAAILFSLPGLRSLACAVKCRICWLVVIDRSPADLQLICAGLHNIYPVAIGSALKSQALPTLTRSFARTLLHVVIVACVDLNLARHAYRVRHKQHDRLEDALTSPWDLDARVGHLGVRVILLRASNRQACGGIPN